MFERHKIPTYTEAYLAVGPTVCKRNKGRYVKSLHSGSQVYSIALQNECYSLVNKWFILSNTIIVHVYNHKLYNYINKICFRYIPWLIYAAGPSHSCDRFFLQENIMLKSFSPGRRSFFSSSSVIAAMHPHRYGSLSPLYLKVEE